MRGTDHVQEGNRSGSKNGGEEKQDSVLKRENQIKERIQLKKKIIEGFSYLPSF